MLAWRWLVVTMVLAAAGCDQAVSFTVDYRGETTVERGGLLECQLAVLNIGGFTDIEFENTQEFRNQGVRPEDVRSMHLTGLTLRVKTPAGADLAYLSRVAFHAEAPGRSKQLVAEREDFPAGVGEVSFRVTGVELAPYVTAERMSITSEVAASRCPDADQTLEATAVFEVEASVQAIGRAAQLTAR